MTPHSFHDDTRVRRVARGIVAGLLVLVATIAAMHARPAAPAAWNWPQEHDLYRWLERDLAPYLAETLSRHPRFAGEPVTLIAVNDETLVERPDALTRDLIVRLRAHLQKAPGINLVWRDDEAGDPPCTPAVRAAYHLTVEVLAQGATHRVAVRALDVTEQRWVAGLAKEWRGKLDRTQRRALAARPDRRDRLGERGAPFSEAQPDLLAERLGTALHSRVCGFVGEPLAVFVERAPDAPALVDKALVLAANHLARASEVTMVADAAQANVVLSAQFVAIDAGLHQLWLTARPVTRDPSLPEFDAHAYVTLRDPAPPPPQDRAPADIRVESAPEPVTAPRAPRAPRAPSFASVSVHTPPDVRACRAPDPWRDGDGVSREVNAVPVDGCFALALRARRDAVVFLLAEDRDVGLVRLLPSFCRTYGRIHTTVRRGDTLRFPDRERGQRHVLFAPGESGRDTFYAIAATDQHAADRIEARLARLPDACGSGRGGSGDTSLADLHALLGELEGRALMQTVEVRFRARHARLARQE